MLVRNFPWLALFVVLVGCSEHGVYTGTTSYGGGDANGVTIYRTIFSVQHQVDAQAVLHCKKYNRGSRLLSCSSLLVNSCTYACDDTGQKVQQIVAPVKVASSPQPSAAPPSSPPTLAALPTGVDAGPYHAVVIGNNDYPALPKLSTAVRDAQAVASVLREKYGFSVTLLLNASRVQILNSLDKYRRKLRDSDNLLIYYAGHGFLDSDAERGYWLPVDAAKNSRGNWLSNADITDTLKALAARHVMVVADSCYSGTLTRSTGRGITITPRKPDYISRLISKKSRTVLASGSLEPVADSGGGGHSVFAKAILRVLRDNTGVIDGTQLFATVREQVRVNARQTPQYQNIRFAGHEVGGDFVFVRRN